MSNIAACGCYIPMRRLPLALLAGRPAKPGAPERAVAWFDEDSVTMAVEAARDCLQGRDRSAIDLVIFATTSHAFAEKQGAVLIACALGLNRTVRTVDIAHSLRGGSQALQMALDAVAAGSAREALVLIADSRLGAPGSQIERHGGDGAAAFLIAAEGAAQCVGSAQSGEELVDVWRRAPDRYSRSWEERFVVQHGYLDNAARAAVALRERCAGREPASWHWALSAPDARSHARLAAQLQISDAQLLSPLFGSVGYCGVAHAPLQLISALSAARAGEHVALLSHGDGAEVLLFEVKQQLERDALASALARRRPVAALEHFRRAREQLPAGEYPAVDDQGISATVHFREREENLNLLGQRCACGTAQFPRGRVCSGCGHKDDWQPESYAEAEGRIVTYTLDAFFPAPEPPTAVAIVEVKGGPRIHMQVVDIEADQIAAGLPVRFVFRRIHQVGLRPNYFWKCVPADAAAQEVMV